MAPALHAPQIAFLGGQKTLSPLATLALRAAVVLHKWSMRRRTRIALSYLDDHLLRDIGLNRPTARIEAARLFWRA